MGHPCPSLAAYAAAGCCPLAAVASRRRTEVQPVRFAAGRSTDTPQKRHRSRTETAQTRSLRSGVRRSKESAGFLHARSGRVPAESLLGPSQKCEGKRPAYRCRRKPASTGWPTKASPLRLAVDTAKLRTARLPAAQDKRQTAARTPSVLRCRAGDPGGLPEDSAGAPPDAAESRSERGRRAVPRPAAGLRPGQGTARKNRTDGGRPDAARTLKAAVKQAARRRPADGGRSSV